MILQSLSSLVSQIQSQASFSKIILHLSLSPACLCSHFYFPFSIFSLFNLLFSITLFLPIFSLLFSCFLSFKNFKYFNYVPNERINLILRAYSHSFLSPLLEQLKFWSSLFLNYLNILDAIKISNGDTWALYIHLHLVFFVNAKQTGQTDANLQNLFHCFTE